MCELFAQPQLLFLNDRDLAFNYRLNLDPEQNENA